MPFAPWAIQSKSRVGLEETKILQNSKFLRDLRKSNLEQLKGAFKKLRNAFIEQLEGAFDL